MDEGSDHYSIWKRLTSVFHRKQDTVEKAIREASEDGELDAEEGSMLLSILRLDELQVQDIMTPRTDIACVSDESTVRDVTQIILETGHSRIPVYQDTRDNITGIVYAKDLLHSLVEQKQDQPARLIMREPFFVPETKNVLDLLHEFKQRKSHLAVILDEYGGVTGLVSIEDVLEQIVGDIEDEHDAPRNSEITLQDNGTYLISGRTYLEDLAAHPGIHLESEEVDTLGGYLSHLAGRVPKTGECFLMGGVEFLVHEADAKHIRQVQVTLGAVANECAVVPDE